VSKDRAALPLSSGDSTDLYHAWTEGGGAAPNCTKFELTSRSGMHLSLNDNHCSSGTRRLQIANCWPMVLPPPSMQAPSQGLLTRTNSAISSRGSRRTKQSREQRAFFLNPSEPLLHRGSIRPRSHSTIQGGGMHARKAPALAFCSLLCWVGAICFAAHHDEIVIQLFMHIVHAVLPPAAPVISRLPITPHHRRTAVDAPVNV